MVAVRKVHGSGDNRVEALRGVNAAIGKGTFTAIMGPSGSGKSTFLQCAAGIDAPTSGSVVLDGVELAGMNENRLTTLRREKVGFIFQGFNLLPTLTVEQNTTLPLKLAGRSVDRARVREVLARVGLGERRSHLPGQLSGGQQQRVAVARALVTDPAVIFADEPTGALDSRSARDVLGLLREAVSVSRQTVVMVTHDPIAASYADRVVFLADGFIVDEIERPTPESVAERMTRLAAFVASATVSASGNRDGIG